MTSIKIRIAALTCLGLVAVFLPDLTPQAETRVLQQGSERELQSYKCALPDNMNRGNGNQYANYALVTEGDAAVAAHNIYSAVAVGGTFSDRYPANAIAVHSNTKAYKSYVNEIAEPNGFNFNGLGVAEGSPLSSVVDFAFYEWLAKNAVTDTDSNGFGIHVINHGGTFNLYDFVPGGQGVDDGKTLVVFNTDEPVILTKTSDGRQFGPSVIAPFSKVDLLGEAGFIDGFIVAKEFISTGQNPTQLQMHGKGYTGPVTCGDTSPTVPVRATAVPATPAPTPGEVAATPAPIMTPSPTANANPTTGGGTSGGIPTPCCGWDASSKTCSQPDNKWCHEKEDQCTGACNGIWITGEPAAPTPTPATGGCCGWNDGTNACSKPEDEWCQANKEHCTGNCQGIWYPTPNPGTAPAPTPALETFNSGVNGDPLIMGLKGQLFNFEGESGSWYSAISNPMFQWNMKLQQYDTCATRPTYVNGVGFTFFDAQRSVSKKIEINIVNPSIIDAGCDNELEHCLGSGALELVVDGKTFNAGGDYRFADGTGRVLAYNTFHSCTRKWYDFEVSTASRNLRTRAAETTIFEVIDGLKKTMVNEQDCERWINLRKSSQDLFFQKGHYSTIIVETENVSFHIEYKQEHERCNAHNLDVWISKIEDPSIMDMPWEGVIGETKDLRSSEENMFNREYFLKYADDGAYKVESSFATSCDGCINR